MDIIDDSSNLLKENSEVPDDQLRGHDEIMALPKNKNFIIDDREACIEKDNFSLSIVVME